MVKFHCPHCSAALSGSEEKLGKAGRCPRCGEDIRIDQQPAQLPSVVQLKPAVHSHRLLWTSQGLLSALVLGGLLFSRTTAPETASERQNIRVNSLGSFDTLEVQTILVRDQSGNPALAIGALADGAFGLGVYAPDRTPRYGLTLSSGGEFNEEFYDASGTKRLMSYVDGDAVGIMVIDAKETARIQLSMLGSKSNGAGVIVYDSEGSVKELFATQ